MTTISVILVLVFVCITLLAMSVLVIGREAFSSYEKFFTNRTESSFEKLFLFVDHRKVFVTNVALLVVIPLVVYFLTDGIFFALIALVIVIVAPRVVIRVLEAKRKKQIVEALPDALAQIAGSMRSGAGFTSAVSTMVKETKGPLSQELGLLLKEQKMGISPQDSLENLAERVELEDVDLLVTAALISREVGGNLAETLERLSSTLRRKLEMEGKIRALTSQGKLQGWVVGLLPFGIILALVQIEPEGILPIFDTYLGWGFLTVILLLELMGAVMIRKIVSIDV